MVNVRRIEYDAVEFGGYNRKIRPNLAVTTEKISNFAAENNDWIVIDRTIANNIEKDFQRGKIIVITGARQD